MNPLKDEGRHSFDEFKLYYESTEKVTDRRLDTNRWNYSICIATLVAVATITNWSFTSHRLFWIGLTADLVLCSMAILFCVLWIRQIRDFKSLNNAKFEVLNEMAPRVDFDVANPRAVTSFCPFDKEWERLKNLKAVRAVDNSSLIALNSSNIEYFIPKAFIFLYFSILLSLAVAVICGWTPIPEGPKPARVSISVS